MRSPSWSIPIASRPSHLPLLHAISFAVLFNSLILLLFFLLVLFLPLRLCTPRLGVWHSRLGKRLFGASLVVVSRLFFGDLEYVISSEGEGDTDNWVERDAEGRVIKVNVPKRSIWISNHQTLADWLFLWTFFYLTDSSPSLYIALKSSLEKIPIIGTACNWFGFAFLERNWGKDKVNFERQLEGMSNDCHLLGREGKEEEGELSFLLFPEGTIVTENTRGISTKFAEKSNLKDLKYTLLPRSTGLFFALRQLAIRVPSLRLVDLNVGYPLPRHSLSSSAERKPLYPSEYYSLPSIFLYRVPPPELHFHLRTFELKDIPLGDLTRLKEEGKGEGDDGTEEERKEFEEWLRRRWEEKDDLLKRFNETGSFVERQTRRTEEDEDEDEDRVKGEVAWRPRLRSPVSETLQFVGIIVIISIAFGWGLPFVWQTVKTSLRSTASPLSSTVVRRSQSVVLL
ncbi:uncharacterized protein JCM6883_006019 [Sporobolomyces salmoneus]|uniref:uncharacterized protein n=1 Tax=Sporobolomyces salmoneus TaxID=183962 RepID=UPI00317C5015